MSHKKTFSLMLGLVGLATLLSCGKSGIASSNQSPAMVDRRYNDYARLVAAMPQEEGSTLSNAASHDWYKKYLVDLEKEWQKLETDRLSKMREWAQTELAEANRESRDLLYTFSGPDFLHMFTFFPKAKRYVMVALEPVGSVPDLAQESETNVIQHVYLVDKALNDIHKRSYFITLNMIRDLNKKEVDGATPLICAFLARTGNRILDLKYVKLNDQGELVADTNQVKGKSRQAVQIDFAPLKDPNDLRKVIYFSTDLSDKGFKGNLPLQKYLGGMKGSVAYIKSASYLMHYAEFSGIRNLLLSTLYGYVGDDTGIPYKHFDQKKWNVQLYGKYIKPINDFSGVEQDELRKAYETQTIKPMPANLGYHWFTQKQNLITAYRKPDASEPAAAAPVKK